MESIMTRFNLHKIVYAAGLCAIGIAFFSTTVAAQPAKVDGVIKGRSGNELLVQTSGSQNELVVVLTDSTDVGQVQGMLKARKKDMSMAALIPGLPVKIEGTYNDQHQLVADKVCFKGNDMQQAQAIEAGMHETKVQTQQSKEELEKQRAALQQQQAQLDEHQAKLAEPVRHTLSVEASSGAPVRASPRWPGI
jgi:OmpA-OmpF porin, OOP family